MERSDCIIRVKMKFLILFGLTCLQIFGFNKVPDYQFEKKDRTILLKNDSVNCSYFCNTVSNDRNQYILPAYNNPCIPVEILPVYITGQEERSIQITWTEHSAFDMNGTLLRNEQVFGAQNGSFFNGSMEGIVYNVVYIATDENGLKDSCHFSFTVYESMNCTSPNVVENGKYECTNGTMPRSTCKYMCNEGYKLVGDTSITCLSSNRTFPVWSGNPVCEVVRCSVPTKPENGDISCQTNSFTYQSVCHVTCEKEFTPEGPLIMICQANGLWSQPTLCLLPEPLAIHCISPQIFYTSPNQTSMEAHWREPTSVAIDKNITRLYQTKGPNQGDILDIGRYKITYKLLTYDPEETAECNVQIHIKDLLSECYQHMKGPSNGKLFYNDNNTSPKAHVVCDRGFDLNYGFSGYISCPVGKWEWGQILECNAEKKPNYELNVEVKFFGEGCSQNASIFYEECKETLKKDFEELLSQNCSTDMICSVDNVEVECSKTSNSKTNRDLYHYDHIFSITFTIGVEEASNASDLIFNQENAVKTLWKYHRHWVESTILRMLKINGDFTVWTWNSINYTVPVCKHGYILYKRKCRTCSRGTYFNQTLDECLDCPFGHYKDAIGLNPCAPCPLGSSTKTTGSYTMQDCKDFCSPGSISADGLVSCAVCPQGYYQDVPGQTECKKCLEGTTTILPNSSDINNCTVIKSDIKCMNSSCNGHRCLDKNGSYVYVCSDGWSGVSCEKPPNPCSDNACMNGGKCIHTNMSYVCDCKTRNSGLLCEANADGGWTEWSGWSECSATCDKGIKQRTRQCRNPLPLKYGDQCVGPLSEMKECSMSSCNECPMLLGGKKSYCECKTQLHSGLEECSARCNDGFILVPAFNEFRNITCGLQTGFVWIPANVSVTCVEPVYPLSLRLESSIRYLQQIPTKFYESVSEQVIINLQSTDCFNSPTCNVDVTLLEYPLIDGNDTVNKTTLLTSFENFIKDSDRPKHTVDKTGNDILVLMSKIKDMENTALSLATNTSFFFDILVRFGLSIKRAVKIDAGLYSADVETLTIKGNVNCLPGQIPYSSLCITCPAGTFAVYNRCHLCFKGTFQPFDGQTRCVICPPGLTTLTVGSKHEFQCEEENVETKSESKDTASDENYLGTILGSVFGTTLGGLASAISVKVICDCRNKKKKEQETGSESKNVASEDSRTDLNMYVFLLEGRSHDSDKCLPSIQDSRA